MSQAAIAWLTAWLFSFEPSAPTPPTLPEPPELPPAPTEAVEEAPTEPAAVAPVAPSDAPSQPPPCPCDSADWRCWQEHGDVCHWEPPPATPETAEVVHAPPAPTTPEPKPIPTEPSPPPYRFDTWQRRGVLVSFALGIAGCSREWCEGFKAGGFGGFDIGYRFGIVAPVIGLSIGGGRGGVSEGLKSAGWDPAKSSIAMIDVGVGALVFPARNARVDPYVGARIGGTWFDQDLDYTGDDFSSRGASASLELRRGAARFLAGFDIYIRPIFTLGPRFEVAVPFGGRVCIRGDVVGFPDDRACMKVSDLASDDGTAVPLDTSDLPLPWSISMVARLVLPPPPKR